MSLECTHKCMCSMLINFAGKARTTKQKCMKCKQGTISIECLYENSFRFHKMLQHFISNLGWILKSFFVPRSILVTTLLLFLLLRVMVCIYYSLVYFTSSKLNLLKPLVVYYILSIFLQLMKQDRKSCKSCHYPLTHCISEPSTGCCSSQCLNDNNKTFPSLLLSRELFYQRNNVTIWGRSIL